MDRVMAKIRRRNGILKRKKNTVRSKSRAH
jgi:hypothetical protein